MISPVSSSPPSAPDGTPKDLLKASRDFEALLIAQLLRAAREDSAAAESDSLMEMAESQFASLLAANGGLGLAQVVAGGLSAPPPPPTLPQE
jgi:Rod binding domain-containing protein